MVRLCPLSTCTGFFSRVSKEYMLPPKAGLVSTPHDQWCLIQGSVSSWFQESDRSSVTFSLWKLPGVEIHGEMKPCPGEVKEGLPKIPGDDSSISVLFRNSVGNYSFRST